MSTFQGYLQLGFLKAGRPLSYNLYVPVCSAMFISCTPWTVAYQAPLSMGFSGQEYWSGLPFPFSGDLPDPGIEPEFPALLALADRFFTTEPPDHMCRFE